MDDDDLSTIAYTRYEWDCPACDETNSMEHDPAGQDDECEYCGASIHIRETR